MGHSDWTIRVSESRSRLRLQEAGWCDPRLIVPQVHLAPLRTVVSRISNAINSPRDVSIELESLGDFLPTPHPLIDHGCHDLPRAHFSNTTQLYPKR
jgi:hypothetical protein